MPGTRRAVPAAAQPGPDRRTVHRSAPDLVVEVSSPSTRRLDLLRKRRLYERFGVPEYWFVDLDADRVEVYALCGERYGSPDVIERGQTLRATVLDGFEAAVGGLLV